MKFARLKTKWSYHDSAITAVDWTSERDLQISIDLDGHWNKAGVATAILLFRNVRNRPQVETALETIAQNQTHQRWIAEIVNFERHGKTSYILHTSPQPSVIIDCSSYVEV
jgi:hypothetical protein